MTTTILPNPSQRPPDQVPRWRMIAATTTAIVVAVAAVIVAFVLRSDPQAPSPVPGVSPSVQPSTQPSGGPSSGGPSSSTQPPAVFGYQPLWPFGSVADAAAWQESYRSGGHQPWHLDAGLTALAFTQGFLGYQEVDRVAGQTSSGRQTWVSVGYANPNGQTSVAAVVHLARIGTGADAAWEVVGTRDTTLTLTRPGYGSKVASPVTVGGRITGVDESLRVQVLALGRPVLGQVTGIPAGGHGSPWSAQVAFTAPVGTVLTVAVSTGGHVAGVERFAITGVRVGANSPAIDGDVDGDSRPDAVVSTVDGLLRVG